MNADSPEWEEFKRLLQEHSAIYFQYRRGYPYRGWEKYCHDDAPDKTAIRHWMKPTLIDYFQRYNYPDMFEFDSLWAGFIIHKKTEKQSIILDNWLQLTLFRPDLVVPPFGNETIDIPETFMITDAIRASLRLSFSYIARKTTLWSFPRRPNLGQVVPPFWPVAGDNRNFL